jgi:hypothetical protein
VGARANYTPPPPPHPPPPHAMFARDVHGKTFY